MSGTARLVDSFLAVDSGGSYDPAAELPAPMAPDGNTLLHIFGAWLFKGASHPGDSAYASRLRGAVVRRAATLTSSAFAHFSCAPRFESGRAVALGTLCRIFSAPQRRTPFLRTYLEQFYACVARGARGEPPSLVAMLVNSEHLFMTQTEGVITVVPDFVVGLRRVLPKVRWAARNTELLRHRR